MRVRAPADGYGEKKSGDPSSGTNGRVSGVIAVPPTLHGRLRLRIATGTVAVKINTNPSAHAVVIVEDPRQRHTAYERGRTAIFNRRSMINGVRAKTPVKNKKGRRTHFPRHQRVTAKREGAGIDYWHATMKNTRAAVTARKRCATAFFKVLRGPFVFRSRIFLVHPRQC